MARNGVIGRDNALPWHLPEDLKHFKAVTLGKPILMGRKTFESIGKPLPGRLNIVLTQDRSWHAAGVVAVRSVAEALEQGFEAPELACIGGAEIFRLLLPQATRLYLTRVQADVPGDTFFPTIDWSAWGEADSRTHAADGRNAYAMTFITLNRERPDAR
jgi:dihydrofolate reductase